MKTKKYFLITIAVTAMAFLSVACSAQTGGNYQGNVPVVHTENNVGRNGAYQGAEVHQEYPSSGEGLFHPTDAKLTDAEIADLLFMREEEKMARDIYASLYSQWGLPVFQSIAQSEQNHMDSILELLAAYDLDDPAAQTNAGEFINSDLQQLYDTLVSRGQSSLEEALRVGALIEEVDILDLQDAIQNTDKADIVHVYSNLMFGSENHLRSFTGQLTRQVGVTYEPLYLDQESYQQIITKQPSGRGRAGN
ncbi:MAG TPA: hypothetical protein DCK95_06375 [Anaerolineaceae bacterium]|nr:hypothetical protein [Anaerolineaceae bacterium]